MCAAAACIGKQVVYVCTAKVYEDSGKTDQQGKSPWQEHTSPRQGSQDRNTPTPDREVKTTHSPLSPDREVRTGTHFPQTGKSGQEHTSPRQGSQDRNTPTPDREVRTGTHSPRQESEDKNALPPDRTTHRQSLSCVLRTADQAKAVFTIMLHQQVGAQ